MSLELKQVQADRLDAIVTGDNRGNHSTQRRAGRYIKITSEQVVQIKQKFSAGVTNVDLQVETGLSEWIISGVKKGRYDSLVKETKRCHSKNTSRQ